MNETKITADVELFESGGYIYGSIDWESETDSLILQELIIANEHSIELNQAINNLLYVSLFIVALLGIIIGQNFVKIFKTR